MTDVSRAADRESRVVLGAVWLLGLLAFAAISAWLNIADAQRQLDARGSELQRTIG